jgi:hypothetical protein
MCITVEQFTKLDEKIDSHTVILARIDEKPTNLSPKVDDHETRIRDLEHKVWGAAAL